MDSYICFGTDDLYLDYLVKFVSPGSQIGMVFVEADQGEFMGMIRSVCRTRED